MVPRRLGVGTHLAYGLFAYRIDTIFGVNRRFAAADSYRDTDRSDSVDGPTSASELYKADDTAHELGSRGRRCAVLSVPLFTVTTRWFPPLSIKPDAARRDDDHGSS